MAAHRYWRVALPTAYGGGNIEISEFHLLVAGGSRVDASATLTSSVAPVSGLLASLQDNDLNTLTELSPGTRLTWDLGVGITQDVTNFQIGGGDYRNDFPSWVEGSYSDDGVSWTVESALRFIGPTWPGVRTKTTGTPMASSGYLISSQRSNFINNGGYTESYQENYPILANTLRTSLYFSTAVRGRIVGTVARDADPANVPLRRRVRLYRDRDGMFIRETWSDAAGNYQFDYIEEWEAYTVIANDYEFFYRAVVADNLTLANGGVELI